MGRPAFSLTDNEARLLIFELAGIEERCPINSRDHRQFVRNFIRAVHGVTGKTFSPAIYRRLRGAYAPERKPSTATFALEKERFAKELDQTQFAAAAATESTIPGGDLEHAIKLLLDELPTRLAQRASPPSDGYQQKLRCVCSDADFIASFESKYGVVPLEHARRPSHHHVY